MGDSTRAGEPRQTVPPRARKRLSEDAIGSATDRLFDALRDLIAEVIGRASSMAASAILTQVERTDRLEARLQDLEKRIRDLEHGGDAAQ